MTMQRILGATPEKDKVAYIAKNILILSRKMPKELTEDDIILTSKHKHFDPYSGGDIQEAIQMLAVACEEERGGISVATIEAVEEDAPKDVTVRVERLNLENETEEDKKAREVIENKIIPALANNLVCVVVLYMPAMEAAKHIVRRADVIPYANSVIESARKRFGSVNIKDFALVEFDLQGTTEQNIKIAVSDVRVTQLTK